MSTDGTATSDSASPGWAWLCAAAIVPVLLSAELAGASPLVQCIPPGLYLCGAALALSPHALQRCVRALFAVLALSALAAAALSIAQSERALATTVGTAGCRAGGSSAALLTGASAGIGRALALQVADRANCGHLVLVARREERLQALRAQLAALHPGLQVHIIPQDLARADAPEALHKSVRAALGADVHVEVLLLNAGAAIARDFLDTEMDEIVRNAQLNMLTPVALAREFAQDMAERKHGHIVIMSSIAGEAPGVPHVALYAASKGFLTSLGKALSQELLPHGVTVTTVLPGATQSEFAAASGIEDAVSFVLPGFADTPDRVAEEAVQAMLRRETLTVLGVQNWLFVKLICKLFADPVVMHIAQSAFRPMSHVFNTVAVLLPW